MVMPGPHEVAGHVRRQHVVDQRLVAPAQVGRLLRLRAHALAARVTRALQRLALTKNNLLNIEAGENAFIFPRYIH